ncbi:MAG: Lrp/AsnC ligand binding domain-containing protein [Dehalococcoidia bacterium]|nr:Lrp/AsnC ligand binding domain-containing protein [Dehalococcoidia bacterium]MDD5493264.1 Lrp/AsnC ligand binding domain-containing protein [Dehalococcoidia bacterium]
MANKKAYVLIQTETGKADAVVKTLRGKPGILSADVVTGPHDVILIIQGVDTDAIAKIVVNQVQAVQGVHRTITYMALSGD